MIKLRATLLGKTYNVLVEELGLAENSDRPLVPTAANPLESAAMSLGPAPHVLVAASKVPGASLAEAGMVLSPLAGKVVSIDVKIGESVPAGAQVATIEAMKMNTYIFAPQAGKVIQVEAHAGDVVEEGAFLLQLG